MEDKLYYIWIKGEKLQLTKNFNSSELECNCKYSDCVEQKMSKIHLEKLQNLRDKKGPMKVTSGFRCVKHNTDIGGEKNSQHLKGNATDLQASNYLPIEIADECETMFDGLGRYKSFTHVDSRGVKARWGNN